MLVYFQDQLHWVIESHEIIEPCSSKAINKRKRKSMGKHVNILINVSDDIEDSRKIAAMDEHCQSANVSNNFDWESFRTMVEKSFDPKRCDNDYEYDHEPFWKLIYSNKTYFVKCIDKVLKDGFICQLENDDIRHFKFEKVHSSGCGTGIIYGRSNI
jgi:hypothetical protein